MKRELIFRKIGLASALIISQGGIVKIAIDPSLSNLNLLSYFYMLSDSGENREKNVLSAKKDEDSIEDRVYSENWTKKKETEGLVNLVVGPEREKIRAEANRIREILDDYTFKLFTPCGYGTGWILDYQLPHKSGSYPTTWYIATNAHVIEKFRFSKNPYRQLLPKEAREVRALRRNKNYVEVKRKYRYTKLDSQGGYCSSPDRYGHFDMNISRGQEGMIRDADLGAIALGQIEEPKLFYSAFNFLDKKISGVDWDHYIDFAVLELKFTSEENARVITGNFADKYPVTKVGNTINIFEKALEDKYDQETLDNLQENFYMLAYPEKKNKWISTFNFDTNSAIASRLRGEEIIDEKDRKSKQKFKGFVRASEISKTVDNFLWAGKKFQEFGHHYEMLYNPLGQGSSGGLLVDKNGGAVGITGLTTVGQGAIQSWFIPLRSSGFIAKESGIYTPRYDLILGAEGQVNSFREQVEKYILKRGRKTWLSVRRGWKYDLEQSKLPWF